MENPKVSVLMPACGESEYIREAIESILNQTFADFEFLIIDDGLADSCVKIIEKYQQKDSRIIFIKNKKGKGIVGALNTGIEMARGEYIARMDNDDISLPQRLEKQVSFLNFNPNVGVCGTWVELIGAREGVVWRLPEDFGEIKSTMLFHGAITHPTAMIRKKVLDENNLWYDNKFIYAEDYDLWTRLAEVAEIVNLPEIMLKYRIHSGNTRILFMEKQIKATNEIRLRQIRKLRLSPSKKELELHFKISNGQYIGGRKAMEKVEKWMSKLIEANKKVKIYPEPEFSAVVSKKMKEMDEIRKNYRENLNMLSMITRIAGLAGRILRIVLPGEIVDSLRREGVKTYYLIEEYRRNISNRADKFQMRFKRGMKTARTVPENYKIGFAVLAHERPEYLEACLDSLFRTNLHNYDITFLISDDGSQDPRVKDIINKERDPKYKIIRNFTPKGHNSWAGAFNKAMKKLLEIDDFNIIGSCDCDAVFHPEWLDKTIKIALWAKKNHADHVLGPFSSFNSSDYKFHGVLGTYKSPFGNYVVKERMGALNYFYFKEDFLKLGYYPESRNDETIMTEKFKKLRIRYFSTETSYIEHIGQKSTLNQWRPVPVRKAVLGLNLAKGDWGVDMEKLSPFGFYKYLKKGNSFGSDIVPSSMPIDVIIPVIEKDLEALPYVVSSIRKYLLHPVENIFIVAPEKQKIVDFCGKNDCKFINENSMLPIKKSDIRYMFNGIDRSGWIFQQLLKLIADKISDKENILVLDADTVLVQPQKFEYQNKAILLASDEFHHPYFKTFQEIFGYIPDAQHSFVAHQMLFSSSKLKEIRGEIEKKNDGKDWFTVILEHIDPLEISFFSEYETYGHWMKKNYPDQFFIEYWFNESLPHKFAKDPDKYLNKFGKKFRSVSFHSYS